MLKEQYRLLDAKKAIGIVKMTKAAYGVDLDGNISSLMQRIRRGTYKSKPARITEIPKEDGSKRPLAISCLEDKLVQLACATILNKIYEPLFQTSSYGYRPGKSCHGLTMHIEKSQLIAAGHLAALNAHQRGDRLPSFKFLGFTCYWGKARKGFWRLKYTSRKDHFTAKLKAMKQYLRKNLNARNTVELCNLVIQVVRGWLNYQAISDNNRRVSQFILRTKRIMFWWFNRRGGKRYVSWAKVLRILKTLGFPERWKTKSMF
jgi:hypothetical protein